MLYTKRNQAFPLYYSFAVIVDSPQQKQRTHMLLIELTTQLALYVYINSMSPTPDLTTVLSWRVKSLTRRDCVKTVNVRIALFLLIDPACVNDPCGNKSRNFGKMDLTMVLFSGLQFDSKQLLLT